MKAATTKTKKTTAKKPLVRSAKKRIRVLSAAIKKKKKRTRKRATKKSVVESKIVDPNIKIITTINLDGDEQTTKHFAAQDIPSDFRDYDENAPSAAQGIQYTDTGEIKFAQSQNEQTQEVEDVSSVQTEPDILEPETPTETEIPPDPFASPPSPGGYNKPVEDIFAPRKHFDFVGFLVPKNAHKFVMAFVVVALVLVLPIFGAAYFQSLTSTKEKILDSSKAALHLLEKGKNDVISLNFEGAHKNFLMAQTSFAQAQNEFNDVNFLTRGLLTVLPGERNVVSAGKNLLEAGEGLAQVGDQFSSTLYALLENQGAEGEFVKNLGLLDQTISAVLPKIALAETSLNEVSNQEQAVNLPVIKDSLIEFSSLVKSIINIAGHNQWRRYLVLFQNNNELRATGGFVGSFALIDVEDGKIKKIEIPGGGTYDLQGSLTLLSASPSYLHIINPRLEFHDANIWPDFRASAQKLGTMLEQAYGTSVDGVIAVNVRLVESILDLTGPIEMKDYGRVLGANNFTEEVQYIAEFEYDQEENKPKQIIADFTPKLFEEIEKLDTENRFAFSQVIYDGLKEKDIQLYSYNDSIQSIIESFGWSGAMESTQDGVDYISVIHTNIAGQKTDQLIDEKIDHSVELSEEKIIDTVTITRTHNGQKGELLTGVQNNSYIRVYVPQKSRLISGNGFESPDISLFEKTPEGFTLDNDILRREGGHFFDAPSGVEIYNEADKAVFAGWMFLKPGETKSITLSYELPYSLTDKRYSLLVQKQSGSKGSEYGLKIYPSNYAIAKTFPEQFTIQDNALVFTDTLTVDKFFGILFE